MRLLYANNAYALVIGSLAAGATTINVDPTLAARFPSPAADEYFKLTIEDLRVVPTSREIVHCTARSAGSLTVVRAREGTAALAFNAGAVVSNRLTAGTLSDFTDAVASFGELWLGVFAVAPTLDNQGNPITTGALYFNSVTNVTYAWDGAQWRAQLVPSLAVAMRLYYDAAGGQTEFGAAADIYGNTLTTDAAAETQVLVYKNGLLLVHDATGVEPLGEYTIDYPGNQIVLNTPAALNDLIELQQLVPAADLAPLVATVAALETIVFNGVDDTFPLLDLLAAPVTPSDAYALNIYIDGVEQQPDVDFTVAGSDITFVGDGVPYGAETTFWGTYFREVP